MTFCTATPICLVLILAIVALFDYLIAVTLEWQYMALPALLATLIVTVGGMATRKVTHLIYIPLFLLALLILQAVETSPIKPFRRFYLSLRPGLTQSEIPNILQRCFPPGGAYKQPSAKLIDDSSMVFTLDPHDGRYNAEVVHISFENGRVKSMFYSPD